jgi:UDP-N-acetylmuramate-alanine ligase
LNGDFACGNFEFESANGRVLDIYIASRCGDFDSIANLLRKTVSRNDTVVIMGAGDIFKLFEKLGL